jgi:hypothetical protein
MHRRPTMVFRRDEKGGGWHEPPYTWEEEMDLYRRMSPKEGFTIYHGSPRKRGPVPVADRPVPSKRPPQKEK